MARPSVFRRQKIYVDWQVQGGIVFRLAIIWLLTTTIAVFLSALLQFSRNPAIGLEAYLADSSRYWIPTLMAFGAMLPMAGLSVVRFTHRFAGPIVRLRRVMRELADGQTLQPISFREKDYWHDLATEFNRVAEELTRLREEVARGRADRANPEAHAHDAPPAILPLVASGVSADAYRAGTLLAAETD